MFTKTFRLSLAATCLATAAHAAPIDAFSELDLFHRFTFDGGDQPPGIGFSFSPGLDIEQTAETTLDAPGTVEVVTPFTQVGALGPPAVPFLAQREVVEATPDGTHVASAAYDISILSQLEPDPAPITFVVDRTVDTSGTAAFTSTDGTVSGDATSGYLVDRFYTLTNFNDFRASFNIIGEVGAAMLASYDGAGGSARATLNYLLNIDAGAGVDTAYFPVGSYMRDAEDADPGASVIDSFWFSNDGFAFSVDTTATGSGGATLASYEGGFRYVLGISMDPGAQLILNDRFVQSNTVDYRAPDIAPVPLPASLPLLLVALGGLSVAVGRRRGRA